MKNDGAAEGANIIQHPRDVKAALERMRMTDAPKLVTKCQGLSKDAESAISRASSVSCKQAIMNLACQQNSGTLYTSHISRQCPLQGAVMKF